MTISQYIYMPKASMRTAYDDRGSAILAYHTKLTSSKCAF